MSGKSNFVRCNQLYAIQTTVTSRNTNNTESYKLPQTDTQ